MSALTALTLCPPVTGIFLPNPCHSQTDTNTKQRTFLVPESLENIQLRMKYSLRFEIV